MRICFLPAFMVGCALPATGGTGPTQLGTGSGASAACGDLGITAGTDMLDFGRSVAWGDLDGDGLEELAVGAPGDFGGDAGHVVVLAGGPTGVTSTVLADLVGPSGLGSALAVGDVDGDGDADLVVGAAQANEVHVFLGPVTGAPADSVLVLPTYGDGFGMAVSVGDGDGDGVDDVAVGAYVEGVYVWRGGPGGPAGAPDVNLAGDGNEQSGTVTAFVGDVDGDGRDELAIVQFDGHRVDVFPGAGLAGELAVGLPLVDGKRAARLAGADVDGDGLAEVVAGGLDTWIWKGGPAFVAGAAPAWTAPGELLARTGDGVLVGDDVSAELLAVDAAGALVARWAIDTCSASTAAIGSVEVALGYPHEPAVQVLARP